MSAHNGNIVKGALADAALAGQSGIGEPQTRHGLTESQFINGYAIHVRDNLNNDKGELQKALSAPTERTAEMYQKAAAALGVAFTLEP